MASFLAVASQVLAPPNAEETKARVDSPKSIMCSRRSSSISTASAAAVGAEENTAKPPSLASRWALVRSTLKEGGATAIREAAPPDAPHGWGVGAASFGKTKRTMGPEPPPCPTHTYVSTEALSTLKTNGHAGWRPAHEPKVVPPERPPSPDRKGLLLSPSFDSAFSPAPTTRASSYQASFSSARRFDDDRYETACGVTSYLPFEQISTLKSTGVAGWGPGAWRPAPTASLVRPPSPPTPAPRPPTRPSSASVDASSTSTRHSLARPRSAEALATRDSARERAPSRAPAAPTAGASSCSRPILGASATRGCSRCAAPLSRARAPQSRSRE